MDYCSAIGRFRDISFDTFVFKFLVQFTIVSTRLEEQVMYVSNPSLESELESRPESLVT